MWCKGSTRQRPVDRVQIPAPNTGNIASYSIHKTMKTVLLSVILMLSVLVSCDTKAVVEPTKGASRARSVAYDPDMLGQWKFAYVSWSNPSNSGIHFASDAACYGNIWLYLERDQQASGEPQGTMTVTNYYSECDGPITNCSNGTEGHVILMLKNAPNETIKWAHFGGDSELNTSVIRDLSNTNSPSCGAIRSDWQISFNSAKTAMFLSSTIGSSTFTEYAWVRASGGPSVP